MAKQIFTPEELRYLKLLAQKYPTVQAASTEIINLQAILNLPKGTEHFISDIHGEYEAFLHILNSCSGVIKEKIDVVFASSISKAERDQLATLIYYPQEKLELVAQQETDLDEWYRITLHRLIEVCRLVSSKYTRSKVRKALPKDYAYIIDELLHTRYDEADKKEYFENIITTILSIGRAPSFITALCQVIKRLAVDHMHIVGDLFDRGPRADIILDSLMDYHSVDIQWGNHDILWMGAAAGSAACIANVVRIALRYANMDALETGYGINLLPLATFANRVYREDPCQQFTPKVSPDDIETDAEILLMTRMHKAISMIQFKLEDQLISRHPEYEMDDRLLLRKISEDNKTVEVDGVVYELNDTNFPTLDHEKPWELSEEEQIVVDKLCYTFRHSEKLQKHIRFMYAKGSMYLVYNNNLLFHACVLLNEDGTFKVKKINNKYYSGRSLMDKYDQMAREAYFGDIEECPNKSDFLWYLWCNKDSPLFGKDKMATFERYFIEAKETHLEKKNPYYELLEKEAVVDEILEEFGLHPEGAHIVNGHVPVKCKNGESPIKCNGKVLVIDGGFSKAYQSETGIAGYTLIYHSRGLQLAQHEPFQSTQKAIKEGIDIISTSFILEFSSQRMMVRDTDIGKELITQIQDLKKLLVAYRNGYIKEKS